MLGTILSRVIGLVFCVAVAATSFLWMDRLTAAGVLALTMVVAFLVVRRLLAPLTELCRALELLAEGRSAKEIGRSLFLSQATVRNHVRSLLQALGAHSQLEALAKARKLGLVNE